MVLIRNTSVDPPYIYFMFNGGTLDLKKLIASSTCLTL